jgi:hypothetical protein
VWLCEELNLVKHWSARLYKALILLFHILEGSEKDCSIYKRVMVCFNAKKLRSHKVLE